MVAVYKINDLLDADKRILQRWKRNNIKVQLKKNQKILIVGTLNYINQLNKLGSKKVYAIDNNKKPKFLCLERFKNVKFKKTNFKKINFKNNTFDFIFCNGILSHLDNWEMVIKEFYRILRIGGKVWLNVFGNSKFRRLPISINKKLNLLDLKKIVKILTIEKWNIQKINYIANMIFWKKRILFNKNSFESKLKIIGFKKIKFCRRGVQTDLNEQIFKNKKLKGIFNDGDLRYLISK